jgi:hypothetical protein
MIVRGELGRIKKFNFQMFYKLPFRAKRGETQGKLKNQAEVYIEPQIRKCGFTSDIGLINLQGWAF